jgi:hypothetical protein
MSSNDQVFPIPEERRSKGDLKEYDAMRAGSKSRFFVIRWVSVIGTARQKKKAPRVRAEPRTVGS